MSQLLSVKDVSQRLKVHPGTVYRLVERGAIPYVQINGRSIRFRWEEVEKWLSDSPRRHSEDVIRAISAVPSLTLPLEHGKKSPGGFGEMAKAKSKTRLNFGYGAIYQRKTRDGRIRWYLDYRDAEGKRIQRVEPGASSIDEATAALKRAVLAEAAKIPGAVRSRSRVTFAEFADIFVTDYAMNVKRSWRGDKYKLDILAPFFKDLMLDEITPLMIQKCVAWRLKAGNTKSTSNRYLALLKTMFNVAIEEGYLEKNPAAKIKLYSEKDCLKERILVGDEETRLMRAAYPVLRSVFCVALNTGMRHGEILGLKWSNVDFEKLSLKVEKTKSGRPRTIPLNPPLLEELLKLRSQNGHSPYIFPNAATGRSIRSMKTSFGAACRRAGITGLRFHDLRHTFGSRLVEKGADIETVRSLLGHSSIAITQRYVHSTDERRRAAVDKLAHLGPTEPQKGPDLLHGCDTAADSRPAEDEDTPLTQCLSAN